MNEARGVFLTGTHLWLYMQHCEELCAVSNCLPVPLESAGWAVCQ